mmetsp:Transcript_129494/g.276181  ORF Transcript_129494/g.276181 Transcript_129494/m.276181 type:complete len:818 (+) Transcript_129494:116-2569(+)
MQVARVGYEDGQDDLKPLEGLLVEIKGLKELIEPLDQYGDVESVDVNGLKGRATAWDAAQAKYIVQTFSGLSFYIAEENLAEFEPPDAEEEGGFDVAWPTGPTANSIFASMVCDTLNDKGYCVIQTFLGDGNNAEAAQMCKSLNWGRLKGDVEEYLGTQIADGKVAWLQYEEPTEDGITHGMRVYDLETMWPDMAMEDLDPLNKVDKALTNLAGLMWPFTVDFEDDKEFMAWGRTSGLVRAGYEDDDPEGVKKHTIGGDGPDDFNIHMGFCDTKKLCVMYVMEAEGGGLQLIPNAEAYDLNEVTIPLSKNKMIVFRCDEMGMEHSYKPVGKNLIMQTWVLDEPPDIKEQEEALRIIDGPPEPEGQRNNVMAVQTRYPGCGYEPYAYWNMLVTGSDTQIQVPTMRWDIDIYYRKEHTIGFSMTCHGAMIQQVEIETFDNKFFGISAEEAETMAPYQRICLEVGYEALYRAGHRREQMKGWRCGVFVGDSGSDWDSVHFNHGGNLQYAFAGRERCVCAGRLSHIMGMNGPLSTSETACSSSLVACGIAQMNMRKVREGQQVASLNSALYHGLVIGTNTLIGPFSYISLSGPGMLTSMGRCFTFDHSADGFARGEGIGAVKLKVCENEIDSIDRVAILIGCCINQDGRSASMTAPHGPSQQEVIRNSMREGGLSPNMITIAECHGTGTALGDPIEVGALRGVMRSDRDIPMLKTSAKTNIGHLEAAAGVAGLIKCIMMLQYCSGAPNCHLLVLNPHLDVNGYPVYFQTESMDFGHNSGLTGVSSFGFGGTNARADVWGHAAHGQRYSITGTTLKSRSFIL